MEKKIFFLILLFSIVLISSCQETIRTIEIEKEVPNEKLHDLLGIVSFGIAVIFAGIAVHTEDNDRRFVAGVVGIIFLIVGMLLLKVC